MKLCVTFLLQDTPPHEHGWVPSGKHVLSPHHVPGPLRWAPWSRPGLCGLPHKGTGRKGWCSSLWGVGEARLLTPWDLEGQESHTSSQKLFLILWTQSVMELTGSSLCWGSGGAALSWCPHPGQGSGAGPQL